MKYLSGAMSYKFDSRNRDGTLCVLMSAYEVYMYLTICYNINPINNDCVVTSLTSLVSSVLIVITLEVPSLMSDRSICLNGALHALTTHNKKISSNYCLLTNRAVSINFSPI